MALTDPSNRATFAALLESIYLEKYTGPVIVHFAEGQPKAVEFPSEPTVIAVDRVDTVKRMRAH